MCEESLCKILLGEPDPRSEGRGLKAVALLINGGFAVLPDLQEGREGGREGVREGYVSIYSQSLLGRIDPLSAGDSSPHQKGLRCSCGGREGGREGLES